MKVMMKIENKGYTVTLNNSKAAKDFSDLFPLTLTLKDFSNTEKVSDLPKSLDISDSPSGVKAAKGDISYYAPWGNLAIFYKDFRYSEGLVNLGKINEGSDMLTKYGDHFEVTFMKAD